jgi:indolepyruvate ferredoxin oxidoreductase alpha subunit
MTVLILDNETVAMTGLQPTVLSDSRLAPIVIGIGVDPDHVHVVDMQPRATDELAAVLRTEMEHEGVSVVIAVRECVEKAKHDRRAEARREG